MRVTVMSMAMPPNSTSPGTTGQIPGADTRACAETKATGQPVTCNAKSVRASWSRPGMVAGRAALTPPGISPARVCSDSAEPSPGSLARITPPLSDSGSNVAASGTVSVSEAPR